jgi:hypothetical protein
MIWRVSSFAFGKVHVHELDPASTRAEMWVTEAERLIGDYTSNCLK